LKRLCNRHVEIYMSDTYDVYRQNGNGDRIWVETVIGMDQLKKRLMKISSIKPGIYLVYDPTEARFLEPFAKSE
jgi:hypothetical protein